MNRHDSIHAVIDRAEELRVAFIDSVPEDATALPAPPLELLNAVVHAVETFAGDLIPEEDRPFIVQFEDITNALLRIYTNEDFVPGRDRINNTLWTAWAALLARREQLRRGLMPLESIAELKAQGVRASQAAAMTGWSAIDVQAEYDNPGTHCQGEAPINAKRLRELIGPLPNSLRLLTLVATLRQLRANGRELVAA